MAQSVQAQLEEALFDALVSALTNHGIFTPGLSENGDSQEERLVLTLNIK